jgi:hypothetical protein
MKRVKKVIIAVMLLGFVAATATSCTGSQVCMAKKVGNHR